MSTKKEYDALRKEIAFHDKLYYDFDQPQITDSEYDQLYFKLTQIEKEHPDWTDKKSSSQHITGSTSKKLPKIKHEKPMLSLEKTRTKEGLQQFLDKWSTNPDDLYYTDSFLVEPKEDGLTIVLYGDKATQQQPFIAATRGAGTEGEDVTESLAQIDNLKNIPSLDNLIVRGEAIITDQAFDQLNVNGEFMNSRNMVAGSIRTNDTTIAKNRHVKFLAYNIENETIANISTEIDMLNLLQKLGFEIPKPIQHFENSKQGKEDLIDYILSFNQKGLRQQIDHQIDGLVIKPNVIAKRNEIGFTAHHPKSALAFKFESPDAITVLKDVIWQTGRTGQLTPVGIFEPIELLGARTSRASLANYQNIKDRDIKIGDTILVQRSNDVIPQIIKSFKEKRTGFEKEITIPKHAHFEKALLYQDHETKEQIIEKWVNFTSRKGINIDGLSRQTIKQLLDENLIQHDDFNSIFQLSKEAFIQLSGQGETSWYNLQTSLLTARKQNTIETIIPALGIKTIGHSFTNILFTQYASWFELLNDFKQKTHDEFITSLTNLDGIGLVTAEIAYTNLFAPRIIQTLSNLNKTGFNLNIKQQTNISQTLQHLKFVITGALTHTRDEVKAMIEQEGGHVTGSVSKNTDYLVTNDTESTSSKYQKAKTLNIKIINESQLKALISSH